MNKILLAAVALCTSVLSSEATVLLSDNFPTNGDLVGTTPAVSGTWTQIGATSTNPIQVTSGTAVVVGSNSQDATSQFASAQSGILYVGFNLTLTTIPTISLGGAYPLGLRTGVPNSGTFVGNFYTARTTGMLTTEFKVGVANAGSGDLSSTGAATWATNLTLGTTYRIVFAFDTTTDNMTLWVNPATSSSTSVTSSNPSVDVTSFTGLGLRQVNGTQGVSGFDNLIVATTFAEAIPEPSTYALIGLGVGMILWRVRGKRGQA